MEKLNITDVGQYDNGANEVYINGAWAFKYYDREMWGEDYKGYKVSGHEAMILLDWVDGTWFTEGGEEIEGYLYFKPKGESGKLKVTNIRKYVNGVNEVYINNDLAFAYFDREMHGEQYKGCKESGHEAMIILWDMDGTWHTEAGEEIKGYLYFKPKGE